MAWKPCSFCRGIGIHFAVEFVFFLPWNPCLLWRGIFIVIAACFTGATMRNYLSARTADQFAAGALIPIALICWYTGCVPHRLGTSREPLKIRSRGWHEAIVLGFGLSFANLVGRFSASLKDPLLIWPTIVAITVAGYLAIAGGNVLARTILSFWLGRFAPLVERHAVPRQGDVRLPGNDKLKDTPARVWTLQPDSRGTKVPVGIANACPFPKSGLLMHVTILVCVCSSGA
jgi:putative Mn2+ efflux pump MntP